MYYRFHENKENLIVTCTILTVGGTKRIHIEKKQAHVGCT